MTHDIELAISRNKVEGARKLLQEYYEAQDRQEFESKLRAEYDELFPKYRDMTTEEYKEWFTENVLADEKEDYLPRIEIDYSEDETYVTFEDYKNETRVISEAVEATYDENGMELTPAIAEVRELVRPYIPIDITDRVEEYINNSEAYKAILKAKKKELLDTIIVEVNGKVFDGDETARNNMLASIQASQLLAIESTYWKLADNTVAEVTSEEIKEALALAIQRVGEIVTNG